MATVIALALAPVKALPQCDDQSAARTKIMALENAWNNAEKAGDAGALGMILDDGMVYIDKHGSLLTKAQFLEHVKATGPRLQPLVTETISVQVDGETAPVAGTYRASGVSRRKP